MTPLELANQTLSELIEENKDNIPLSDKLMIAYTGYQAATQCPPGKIWNGTQCVDDIG